MTLATAADRLNSLWVVTDARSRHLDLFRGLAAILMILNHAGYRMLGEAAVYGGWAGVLVFLGSAAPALFFFASGVGSGFGAGRGESTGAVLRKILLLLLADALMNWGFGNLLGFDFFGFAAIVTLVLFAVRRTAHPELVAVVLVVGTLLARFALAPFARGAIEQDSVLAFVTGIAPVRHVSYPLGPWLVFPLLGFLVGRRWRQNPTTEELWIVGAAAAACGAACWALVLHGATVFRWGSVSLAYFLCAIAILAVAWLVTRWLATSWPPSADTLALRGPASLLMVPLHYAVLGLVVKWASLPFSPGVWLVATLLLVAAVLFASRALVAGARRVADPGATVQLVIVAVTCLLALSAFYLAEPLVRMEMCSVGQMVIALLLIWAGRGASSLGSQRGNFRSAI